MRPPASCPRSPSRPARSLPPRHPPPWTHPPRSPPPRPRSPRTRCARTCAPHSSPHFADDGVTVRRTAGSQQRRSCDDRPDPPIVLDWRPVSTSRSRARASWACRPGPAKITSKAKPDAPPGYGQYVSVWRREARRPVEGRGGPRHRPSGARALGRSRSRRALRAARAARVARRRGPARRRGAVRARSPRARRARRLRGATARERLRFYRGGHAPAVGKAAALAAPAHDATSARVDRRAHRDRALRRLRLRARQLRQRRGAGEGRSATTCASGAARAASGAS